MANAAVSAAFTYDTAKAEAAMGRLVLITNDATKRMAAKVIEAQAGYGSGIIPESMTGGAERAGVKAGAKFAAGFGMQAKHGAKVAATMIVSVLRDSFASLASGQNPFTVLMQQGPQVLQALTIVGGSIMRMGGAIAAMTAALVGFHFLSKSVFEAWFDGGKGIKGSSEGLRIAADKFRAARKEAELYRDALAAAAQKARELNDNLSKAKWSVADEIAQNRIKNAPDEQTRHELSMDLLKSKLTMARLEMEKLEPLRNAQIPEIATRVEQAELKLERARQAVIDEQKRYSELAQQKASTQPISVTERQRIGAFSNNSINVSLLDVNKRQEEHLREIRKLIGREDGSF